ncbi:LAGLIDADG family homing endonuclease [Azotobacter chroococcum]|uniref:LAGLIDADG family homing endonuclease n=1 Tax=Azotobacter chroococcum TaxID=353 RepID=UPI001EF07CDF|nr:LAGLIDADG family homing endonuclease [Azotobacter chroococcum]
MAKHGEPLPQGPDGIPLQAASEDIWAQKYRLVGADGTPLDADIDASWQRVARALAEVEAEDLREHWYERFLWALRNGAIPAGRIVANAGAQDRKPATSTINCTVSGIIHDSMDDILAKVREAGLTLKAGCVAPDTWVVTEHGVVSARRAAEERHARMLCYDRAVGRFEMRPVERHLITRVAPSEQIEIVSNGTHLKTSVRHPLLVYRNDRLSYVRADEVRAGDALVHHRFAWEADRSHALHAWFAGAHLGDGWAHEKRFHYRENRRAWLEKARSAGRRLVFKILAAEREVVERYATFFQTFCGSRAKIVATATPKGTPVWCYTVASFEAGKAAELIDGQIGRKSATLRVPAWVSAHPDRHFLPFLAGLIDTDGTVGTERGSVIIAMQSPAFAEQLKGLLGLFGVQAGITLRKPREHLYDGNLIRDSGGAMLKISDSAFLARVAEFMADSGKRRRIAEHASQSGQYDHYCLPARLAQALSAEAECLGHRERQALGFYHGYQRKGVISRIWLDRWSARFPHLRALIEFARTLRPVSAVRRNLDIGETFYDFTVEKHHNYLAGENGLMVIHNCGIGYEFSTLRPRGAFVSGAGARTSGPLSFMDIFDKMCFTVSSAGGRRGAQMATFDVAHPDVREFIRAKREDGRLRQFNLSLLITDEFMQAVENDAEWPLVFPVHPREAGALDFDDPQQVLWRDWPIHEDYRVRDDGKVACRVYGKVRARHLWDMLMASTYDFAEPGFILIDRVNQLNNNWWCEEVRATNPCVTGDTRLATQYGLVPIAELECRGVALEVAVDRRCLAENARGVTRRPAKPAFLSAGRAPVWRVVTADGYAIRATAWHDFYSERGKLKLRDLKVGDRLLIQSGKGLFGQEGSEELGILLGLIAGDGHFTHRGKGWQAAIISLWGEERALGEPLAAWVNALTASLGGRRRVSAVAVPQRNQVFVRSILLARLLEHYGFTAATRLRVPEVVWRGSEACVRGYLRALFQCDGTVNVSTARQSCSVRLASSCEVLLKEVQQLLANFGIYCSIRQRRAASRRRLPDGRGGQREYACQADFELIIDGESRERFMAEIGFLLSSKTERYRAWAQGRPLRKTQRFSSPIASIEYAGEEPVYDTTQPDGNAVIFNGLVTGQCGEQPLPPYGACLLGSVNLTAFVEEPFSVKARFDWERFREVVRVFTRLLDNVVEINNLPLEAQRREILDKRRHGMGFLGLGSALTLLRLRYGSAEACVFTEEVAREMALVGWQVALELAKEKGPAPLLAQDFEVTAKMLRQRPEMAADGYKAGDKVPGRVLHARYSRYMQRLAEFAPELVAALAGQGARFTHHSSIAPTGTISLSLANNASNGIEPSFAHQYSRNLIRPGRKAKEKVEVLSYELLAYRALIDPQAQPDSADPAHRLPDWFVSADDIGPTQHVDIQAAAQKWVDSSISKTANVPTDYPFEAFKDIYRYAWRQGLKGCTTFRFNPAAFQGVLVREADLENTLYRFELEDGSVVELRGNELVEYDGEVNTAANLFDALKEGYYGKY